MAKEVPLPCKPDSVPLLRGWTVISLTPPRRSAPLARSATITRRFKRAGSPSPVLSCTTRGLPCRSGCPRRGGLLPHHFTLACALAGHRRYASCCTFRPGSSRFPSPTFVRRVALWCPDFPQPPLARKLRPSGERHTQGARSNHGFQEKHRRSSITQVTTDAPFIAYLKYEIYSIPDPPSAIFSLAIRSKTRPKRTTGSSPRRSRS